jgi:hypothetical protein
LISTLRDDERTRVARRAERSRTNRDLVHELCFLEADLEDEEVTDVDRHVGLGDRAELVTGRAPVLLHDLPDGRRCRDRARRPVAVRRSRGADGLGRHERDGGIHRVRAALEVDRLVVVECADLIVRECPAVLDRAGLEDRIADAGGVDPREDVVVREGVDVRAVRDAHAEGSRRSLKVPGRDPDRHGPREAIGRCSGLQDPGRHALDGNALERVGHAGNVLLLLVDPDHGLAGGVQPDTDSGDAGLVEDALGVLLLGGDRLVEPRR